VLCDTEEEAKAAYKETSYGYACQRYTRSADGDFAPAAKQYGWMGQDLGWIKHNLLRNELLIPPEGPNHAVIINSGEGHGVTVFSSFDAARTFYEKALDLDAKMGVAQYHRILDEHGCVGWTQFFQQGRMQLSFKDIEKKYLSEIRPNDLEQANSEQAAASDALTAAVDRLQGDVYKDLTNEQAFGFLTDYSRLVGTKKPESGSELLCIWKSMISRFYHHAVLIKESDDKWRVYEIEKDKESKTSSVVCKELQIWLKNTFNRNYSGIFVGNEIKIRKNCKDAVQNNSPENGQRKYHLISANCEHWAKLVRCGKAVSLQVGYGAKILTWITPKAS